MIFFFSPLCRQRSNPSVKHSQGRESKAQIMSRGEAFTANMTSCVNRVWCVPYKLPISVNTVYHSYCWDSFAVGRSAEQRCPDNALCPQKGGVGGKRLRGAHGQTKYAVVHCQKRHFHPTVKLISSFKSLTVEVWQEYKWEFGTFPPAASHGSASKATFNSLTCCFWHWD